MPGRYVLAAAVFGGAVLGCQEASNHPADLLLLNGRVYSFTWDDPAPDGTPASNAPRGRDGWTPDAEAVAVQNGRILFVGSEAAAEAYRGDDTRVIDLGGATVLPGLVDSHVHVAGLGANLERVNLAGVTTEAEAVDRVATAAERTAEGEWIVGWGWDEGEWADRYPDMRLLSDRVPDHPVVLRGLHGFAAWGNRMGFELAGITSATPDPQAGVIVKDETGEPTGILLNNATRLLENALPPPTRAQIESRIVAGLEAMAEDGFVAVHEAGADAELMAAFESLERQGRLALRVYAMLDGRDVALLEEWLARGPRTDTESMLITRSVKAYYDGALGSRGAKLLEDYSDMPGHRGVAGDEYGFQAPKIADMMAGGFQAAIHAIGDAGVRETLDFFEAAFKDNPQLRDGRHRIEHAQVIPLADFERFSELQLVASMEPPHAVEDKAWAEDRVGPDRILGAYAWRTLRLNGVGLVFNSDLPGSAHDIFYGLHAAITRRDRELQPVGGWYPEQNVTSEEAVRAYTVWAARAAFQEDETGVIAPGMRADLTAFDLDPLVIGETAPDQLLDGSILLTVVGGRLVYQRER